MTKLKTYLLVLCILNATACSTIPSPQVSNLRMTTDLGGETIASTYAPLDAFTVFLDVRGIKEGSLIRAVWYAVEAQGVSAATKINTSDYLYKAGVDHIYFNLATWDESSWPAGSYKVVIFIDGDQVGEKAFVVN